jgi:hypothetical protein
MSVTEARHVDNPLAAASSPGERWQFGLRDAFWFTAAVAATAAVARFKGPGIAVLSMGLYLGWLNSRGRLERIQTRRARPKIFGAAWLLLGLSLFLPAMKGCNNVKYRGWETASMAAQWQVGAANEVLLKGNLPEPEEQFKAIVFGVRMTLINLANLLALFSPFLLWRLQRGQGERLGAALAVSAVAVWSVPVDFGLLVGCYVWCAGFLALTIACRIGWRVFAAMAALAAIFLLLATAI